jgi:hypothetical protein
MTMQDLTRYYEYAAIVEPWFFAALTVALMFIPIGGPIAAAAGLGGRLAVTGGRVAVSAGRPATSAMSGLNLNRQLASEMQMLEAGEVIAGMGHKRAIDDVQRLVATYGGRPQDWTKRSSSSYRDWDGLKFETHWYENGRLDLRVELKTKMSR